MSSKNIYARILLKHNSINRMNYSLDVTLTPGYHARIAACQTSL